MAGRTDEPDRDDRLHTRGIAHTEVQWREGRRQSLWVPDLTGCEISKNRVRLSSLRGGRK